MKIIEIIDEVGLKRAVVARSIGISQQLFLYKKLNNAFTEKELEKIRKVLTIINNRIRKCIELD